MTEEKAKTKWCPFARYTSVRGQGINRWIGEDDQNMNPEPAKCIASACMAWRWEDIEQDDGAFNEAMRGLPSGYCGLAGKM